MKLKKLYNFITIDFIKDVIHIILYFSKKNKYFVNKYIIL